MGSMQSTESAARRSKRRSRGLRSARRDSRGLDNFGNDIQSQAQVSHDAGSSSRATADASSITSNDSTKMIIKKEVQWHVDSERGDAIRHF